MASKFTTQGLSFPAQGSAEFNGTSDYIQLNDPFNHTNHTIAAWVYIKDNSGYDTIFDNRDANDDGIRLMQGTSTMFYQLNAYDTTFAYSFANDWVYVVGTYDGTTSKLYFDGSLVANRTISLSIDVSTYNANIGKSTYEGNYFNGNLANVAIWNRALSSDEINSVMWKSYDALEASEKSGLQAWYSLDNIDGTNVPDSSGNGNNGTAN